MTMDRMHSQVCSYCKHVNWEYEKIGTCKAYPQGIPDEIWWGDNPHLTPFPGDNGIRFEKNEDLPNT